MARAAREWERARRNEPEPVPGSGAAAGSPGVLGSGATAGSLGSSCLVRAGISFCCLQCVVDP